MLHQQPKIAKKLRTLTQVIGKFCHDKFRPICPYHSVGLEKTAKVFQKLIVKKTAN